MPRVKLDLGGLEEVATSGPVASAVKALAEEIAANIEAQGIRVGDRDGGSHEYPLPVKVYTDTTTNMRVNRARAAVVLAHASGLAVQAKHGALTSGASSAGLSVKGD